MHNLRENVDDLVANMNIKFTDRATPCVACHKGGMFSYWSNRLGVWIENDSTVPQEVLDALPSDERNRVMRHMTAAGVVPA